MKTLLTGFGPFADVLDNPSGRLAAHFGAAVATGHNVIAHLLPVSFARADREIVERVSSGFDNVLMLGVAGKSMEFRIERYARNQDAARIADNDGCQPMDTPIRERAPERLETEVDAVELAATLRQVGVTAVISDDAGRFVCNRAYYAALHAISELGLPTRCVFIHVPPDPATFAGTCERSVTPFNQHLAAVSCAMEWLRHAA